MVRSVWFGVPAALLCHGEAVDHDVPTVAAGAVFVDGAERVLLVEPTYKQGWEVPGGMVEAGESPLAGCRREVSEELGLEVGGMALLVADWVSPNARRAGGMRWLFDGGTLTADQINAVRLPPGELRSFRFVPADELQDYMPPARCHRVERALAVRKDGRAVYLEDGESAAAVIPRSPVA